MMYRPALPSNPASLLLLSVLLVILATAARPDSLHVTSETLQDELEDALPGTTLLLEPGNYGDLSLRRITGTRSAPIILRSTDPEYPAVFSRMTIRDSEHIILQDLLFKYQYSSGDALSLRPFQILSSDRISVLSSRFVGDEARGVSQVDDGFGTAFGLSVRFTRGFIFEGNEIQTFYRGLTIAQSQDIQIRNNEIHDIRMDGMNFAEVARAIIEENHIHDFNRSLESRDHADMIQFWTASTDSPSQDIIIRNNILNSGSGWYTQSIFMRNELVDRGLAGHEMYYRNILIEGNIIINAHAHGITVGETQGLVIKNNTVVRNFRSQGARDNPNLWTPRIRVATTAENVSIQRNIVGQIVGHDGQRDWTIADNYLVQDRSRLEPGYYGIVFGNQALIHPERVSSFRLLANSPLRDQRIGAPRLLDP